MARGRHRASRRDVKGSAPVASANVRVSLVTADQVLSSLSNVIALVWVAHAFAPVDFGRFSLVVMVYTVAQVAFRSLISTTVVVHPEDTELHMGGIVSSTLFLGIASGMLCAGFGAWLAATGSALGTPLVVFGATLPLLMLQDVGRYIAIARQRPMGAVVIDSLWLVVMAGALAAIVVLDKSSLSWLVAAWAGSGAVAGLWVFVQHRLPGRGGYTWLRDRWHFSWRSLVSGLAASGTLLVAASLMTVLSDATSVAAFRAATLLGAPSTAVQTAVSTSAAADIARERDDAAAIWGHIRRAMTFSFVIGVLNLVVLVFLPDVLGRALLGEAWTLVKPLMLAVSLKVLLMAAQSGVRASLVGQRRIQIAMVTDILSIFLACVCMVIGTGRGGAEGALWGMAVGTGASTACWWVAMWWAERHPEVHRVVEVQPVLQHSA